MPAEYQFGAGNLWGIPVGGNLPVNPTPQRFGTFQEVSVEFSSDVKELYGQNTFPEVIARGKTKITCKAKVGRFSAALLDQLFYAEGTSSGMEAAQVDEAHTIPSGGGLPAWAATHAYTLGQIITDGTHAQKVIQAGTSGSSAPTWDATLGGLTPDGTAPAEVIWQNIGVPGNTITVTNAGTFFMDLGVLFADGTALTKVATGPIAGQYAVDPATGIYTFANADATKAVLISYYNSVSSTGLTLAVANQLMGTQPIFQAAFRTIFNGQEFSLLLHACVFTKLTMQSKIDDFTIPEFDFSAFADVNQKVFDIYSAQ